ncbi:hypothetical protein HCN44_011022 [Aphidius gifuensis]|uniref:Uncharacterized protein n=1 Tax=Aphidius gifuensis TaxID=684658 RepID=A0A835CWQ9_APHGI|nr:uncharacterized protein LOC122850366 [Aphidius gifuensis]KAF7998614.1 hypothetical protein HCN44_011022 [Aphidius gifuensis]
MPKRNSKQVNNKKQLEATEEKKMADGNNLIEFSNDNNDPVKLRCLVQELQNSLQQVQLKLNERDRLVVNQEKRIIALSDQVLSLKEVITLTKNMLEIRNTEVKHLQDDINGMETKMSGERSRHNDMMKKMDAAVTLNATLKNEYETQLHLFQELRGKYEEKIDLLLTENKNTHD